MTSTIEIMTITATAPAPDLVPAREPVVEVDGLVKRYGAAEVVNGIHFTVHRGELFGLLGTNGAGKTTTVEILQGLRRADGGRVRVLGLDPASAGDQLRRRIGAQLQDAALPERMRVAEALALFAALHPTPRPTAELVEEWQLDAILRRPFDALSGGERQRLFVALALVGRPEIVFLDELTQNLDPMARRHTWDVVRHVRDAGTTVVLVTHDVEEAERLCDRIVVMDHGRVVADGTPAAIVDELGGASTVRFTDAEHRCPPPAVPARRRRRAAPRPRGPRGGPRTAAGPRRCPPRRHRPTGPRPARRPSIARRPLRRPHQGDLDAMTATLATPHRGRAVRTAAHLTRTEVRLLRREPGGARRPDRLPGGDGPRARRRVRLDARSGVRRRRAERALRRRLRRRRPRRARTDHPSGHARRAPRAGRLSALHGVGRQRRDTGRHARRRRRHRRHDRQCGRPARRRADLRHPGARGSTRCGGVVPRRSRLLHRHRRGPRRRCSPAAERRRRSATCCSCRCSCSAAAVRPAR